MKQQNCVNQDWCLVEPATLYPLIIELNSFFVLVWMQGYGNGREATCLRSWDVGFPDWWVVVNKSRPMPIVVLHSGLHSLSSFFSPPRPLFSSPSPSAGPSVLLDPLAIHDSFSFSSCRPVEQLHLSFLFPRFALSSIQPCPYSHGCSVRYEGSTILAVGSVLQGEAGGMSPEPNHLASPNQPLSGNELSSHASQSCTSSSPSSTSPSSWACN